MKDYDKMKAILMNASGKLIAGYVDDVIDNCPLDVISLI